MTARHRSRFLVAAAAAILLGACGDEDSAGSPTTPAADPGGLRPPVAVTAVDSSAGAGGGVFLPERAAPTDLSIMPAFGGFTYEVGDGLPALPDDNTGYQYPPGADVDEGTVAALAAALGVAAPPERLDDATTGLLWRAGPDDGTAPSPSVSSEPQLTWYYSAPWGDQAVAVDCAVAEAGSEVVPPADAPTPTSVVDGGCVAPEPPEGVPTAPEAEARANDLLAAMGEDPAAYELETHADEWSASVVAWPSLDGVRVPVLWGFGFGGEGVLQWANGSLADPVPAGPYPLVDVDAAIARLTEQGSAPIMARGDSGVATASSVVAAEPPIVIDPPLPEEDPVVAEPEVATLVDVHADFWWAWDADGSVWLLPAYTFTDTEGRQHMVPAVTDEFLVVEDVPATTVPPEPTPPSVDPARVVGLTVDEANKVLTELGLTLRVVREDGVDLPVTADFSETRVNVAVESGTVTAVVSLG